VIVDKPTDGDSGGGNAKLGKIALQERHTMKILQQVVEFHVKRRFAERERDVGNRFLGTPHSPFPAPFPIYSSSDPCSEKGAILSARDGRLPGRKTGHGSPARTNKDVILCSLLISPVQIFLRARFDGFSGSPR
jgi:hypothetical protein